MTDVEAETKAEMDSKAEMDAKAIEVLYRDEYIAVVNKPAGLMAHSSALARGEDDFLHDRLREQFGCKIYLSIGNSNALFGQSVG